MIYKTIKKVMALLCMVIVVSLLVSEYEFKSLTPLLWLWEKTGGRLREKDRRKSKEGIPRNFMFLDIILGTYFFLAKVKKRHGTKKTKKTGLEEKTTASSVFYQAGLSV